MKTTTTFGEFNNLVTVLNALIQADDNEICMATENLILEPTQLIIKAKLARPDLKDNAGDVLGLAVRNNLFPNAGLRLSFGNECYQHHLGHLLGMGYNDIEHILVGSPASYRKPLVEVTRRDVIQAILNYIQSNYRPNSMSYQHSGIWNNGVEFVMPNGHVDPDFMFAFDRVVDKKYFVRFTVRFSGAAHA